MRDGQPVDNASVRHRVRAETRQAREGLIKNPLTSYDALQSQLTGWRGVR